MACGQGTVATSLRGGCAGPPSPMRTALEYPATEATRTAAPAGALVSARVSALVYGMRVGPARGRTAAAPARCPGDTRRRRMTAEHNYVGASTSWVDAGDH